MERFYRWQLEQIIETTCTKISSNLQNLSIFEMFLTEWRTTLQNKFFIFNHTAKIGYQRLKQCWGFFTCLGLNKLTTPTGTNVIAYNLSLSRWAVVMCSTNELNHMIQRKTRPWWNWNVQWLTGSNSFTDFNLLFILLLVKEIFERSRSSQVR